MPIIPIETESTNPLQAAALGSQAYMAAYNNLASTLAERRKQAEERWKEWANTLRNLYTLQAQLAQTPNVDPSTLQGFNTNALTTNLYLLGARPGLLPTGGDMARMQEEVEKAYKRLLEQKPNNNQ